MIPIDQEYELERCGLCVQAGDGVAHASNLLRGSGERQLRSETVDP